MRAKRIPVLLLAACLMLSAVGCGSVYSSEYYFSEPYQEESFSESEDAAELRDRKALKNAIIALVESGESEGQFRFGNYNGTLLDDLPAVCHEIKTTTPIGVYAVKDISYDVSRIVSYYTAVIKIEYKISLEEIESVEKISGLSGLRQHILELLYSHSESSVIELYSSYATKEYVEELIRDSYYSDPLLVAELPEFSVEAFPDSGPEKIYRMKFEYSAAAESLAEMREELGRRTGEIVSQITAADDLGRAVSAARALHGYSAAEISPAAENTTAYGCLVEGSENPMAVAMAYKALCNALSVPCYVVSGQRRDAEDENYAWNIVEIDGEYYHMDISRMDEGVVHSLLLSDGDIWGNYDWDKENYPVCDGSLRPGNAFGIGNAEVQIPAVPPAQPETDAAE